MKHHFMSTRSGTNSNSSSIAILFIFFCFLCFNSMLFNCNWVLPWSVSSGGITWCIYIIHTYQKHFAAVQLVSAFCRWQAMVTEKIDIIKKKHCKVLLVRVGITILYTLFLFLFGRLFFIVFFYGCVCMKTFGCVWIVNLVILHTNECLCVCVCNRQTKPFVILMRAVL